MSSRSRVVFLDRDGTLNEDRGYVGQPTHFQWLPGALDAMRRLHKAGFVLAVVTNQSGVGHGYYTTADVRALHRWADEQIRAAGAEVAAYRFSPYHPRARVARYRTDHPTRKPGTGMFEAIMEVLAREGRPVDLRASFMVGDKGSDLIPARALGMTTLLVRTGFGNQELRSHSLSELAADHVADDIGGAADRILSMG